MDADTLTGLVATWRDFVDLCESGWDSTPYVCEILKETLEWVLVPEYRVDDPQPDKISNQPVLGCTIIERNADPQQPPGVPPFTIKINISTSFVWPLLVDEFSPAEKAATTLFLAGTMLHELSVSLDLLHPQTHTSLQDGLCRLLTHRDSML